MTFFIRKYQKIKIIFYVTYQKIKIIFYVVLVEDHSRMYWKRFGKNHATIQLFIIFYFAWFGANRWLVEDTHKCDFILQKMFTKLYCSQDVVCLTMEGTTTQTNLLYLFIHAQTAIEGPMKSLATTLWLLIQKDSCLRRKENKPANIGANCLRVRGRMSRIYSSWRGGCPFKKCQPCTWEKGYRDSCNDNINTPTKW